MAEERQPSNVQEGADVEEETPNLPKSAEDRKAAAALSSVAARDDEASQPGKEVDQEALGKAIKNLDIGASKDGAEKKDSGEKKKVVKVDQADVALVVSRVGRALDVNLLLTRLGRWMSWTCPKSKLQIYSRRMRVMRARLWRHM